MTAAADLQASIRTLLEQGLALHHRGRLDDARAVYESVLKLQPRQFDATYLLGMIAAQTDDMARAAALLEDAVAVNPDHPQAHYNLATALAALKRGDEALARYEKALGLKPDYA